MLHRFVVYKLHFFFFGLDNLIDKITKNKKIILTQNNGGFTLHNNKITYYIN